jgi:UDP-N-acetylglucosamine--N-acetylmuramyl-(pentapeptide) pyrophosphoryl-undecaprenol N-acetylglucosamine transferase
LNEAVVKQLPALLELAQLVHISGTRDYTALDATRARLDPRPASRYHLFEYLDQEMPGALAAADLVVARAGAATLGEFPAVGVPSVLVPGRFAAGHQARNAAFLADHGAALPFDEEQLDTALVPTLAELLNDGARLEAMREAARGLAQPHAAEHIGELIEAIAK